MLRKLSVLEAVLRPISFDHSVKYCGLRLDDIGSYVTDVGVKEDHIFLLLQSYAHGEIQKKMRSLAFCLQFSKRKREAFDPFLKKIKSSVQKTT